MRREIRIFWLLALALFCLQMGVSSAGERDAARRDDFSGVDYRDGLLKVSVEDQEFQRVMDAVAQKAGIQIVDNTPADEYLTINFDYLPLEKGLKRLLRGRNYVFVYFSKEASQAVRVEKVWIFPKSGQRRATSIKRSSGSRSTYRARQEETREKMQNVDKESLEEVLHVFFHGEMGTDEEMKQEIKDLEEMGKEFSKALEVIQKTEGFEGETETSLSTQPQQKGPVREMQNADWKNLDEVLKFFSQGERELPQ